jgi:bacteriorhodopsin
MTALCFTVHESKRVFHYLFTVVLLVGSITYYSQAADLGFRVVPQADNLVNGATRQIFYAKYINWAVSFPCISLALGLLSGISWNTIICNMAITWIWVATYLAAAYTTTEYKWGFFAFGTFSCIILLMSTMNECREEAQRIGIGRDYLVLASWPSFLWLLYPVAFGLTDGGNVIGVTAGFIFTGILDILTVIFSFVLLFIARRWDWHRLNLDFSEFRGAGEFRNSNVKQSPPAGTPINDIV